MHNPNPFDPLHNLDQMASLISSVTGEGISRVCDRLEFECKHPGRSVADDFEKRGGPRYVWGEHLEKFYGSTDAFLYELAVWNRNKLKSQLRRWVTRHMSQADRKLDILSVGDGLGFDCVHFSKRKHRPTYFELPGLSERFARTLFERGGYNIPVITDPQAVPKEGFDVITCFDVLEHVPNPPEMVRTLASWLRPGGLLYISAPFYMILPWYPTHLRTSRRFAGSLKLYEQAGLELVGGQFTWYPIVLGKPGGNSLVPASAVQSLAIRLTGTAQKFGRLSALPFSPIHFLRKLNNRAYSKTSEARITHERPSQAN